MPFIKNENTTVQQAMQQAGQMVTQVMGLMNQQKLIAEQTRNNNLIHRRAMATQTWSMISDLAKENPGGLKGAALDYPDMFKDLFYQIDPEADPSLIDTRIRQLQNGALNYEHIKESVMVAAITLGDEFESKLGLREEQLTKSILPSVPPTTEPSETPTAKAEPLQAKRTPKEVVESIEKGAATGPWAMYDKLISEGKAPFKARLDVSKEFRNKILYLPELAEFKRGKRPGKVTEEMIRTSPTYTKVLEETKTATPQGRQEVRRFNKMLNMAGFFDTKPIFTPGGVKAKAGAAKRYSGWIADQVEELGPEAFSEYYNGMLQRLGGFEKLRTMIDPESLEVMKFIAETVAEQNMMPFEQDKAVAQTSSFQAQAIYYLAMARAIPGAEGEGAAMGEYMKNNQAIMKTAMEGMELIRSTKKNVSVNDLVAKESAAYDPTFANFWDMYLRALVSNLGVQGNDVTLITNELTVRAPWALEILRRGVSFGQWAWKGEVPGIGFDVGKEDKAAKEAREEDLTPEQRAYKKGTER